MCAESGLGAAGRSQPEGEAARGSLPYQTKNLDEPSVRSC